MRREDLERQHKRVCKQDKKLSERVIFPSEPTASPTRHYSTSHSTALWDIYVTQLAGLYQCDMISCEGEILAELVICLPDKTRDLLVFLDAFLLIVRK